METFNRLYRFGLSELMDFRNMLVAYEPSGHNVGIAAEALREKPRVVRDFWNECELKYSSSNVSSKVHKKRVSAVRRAIN